MKNLLLSAIATVLLGCGSPRVGVNFAEPNPQILDQYYEFLRTGDFPTKGKGERTEARALELLLQHGYLVRKEDRVEVAGSKAGVPVIIFLYNGEDVDSVTVVHVDESFYTPEELKYVEMKIDMGEDSSASKSRDEERVKPEVKTDLKTLEEFL